MFQQILFRGHLDEEEKLLFVAHKHWIEILVPIVRFVILGLLLPWGLYFLLAAHWEIVLVWNVIFLFWFVYEITDWYLDALLVTNTSVIDIEWHGLFHRTSARVDYTDLKEISYELQGIWSTILGFGLLKIHLNSGGEVNLKNTNNPKKVELVIKGYKDQFVYDQKMTDTATLQEILADLVQSHIAEHGLPEKKTMPKEPQTNITQTWFS